MAAKIIRNYKFYEQTIYCDHLIALSGENAKYANMIKNGWETIKKLRWHLKSEGIITQEILDRNIYEVGRASLQKSFKNIIDYTIKKYPVLSKIENRIFVNLVALGKDVVNSVIDTPELLEFFILEMQPIDLGSNLNLHLL